MENFNRKDSFPLGIVFVISLVSVSITEIVFSLLLAIQTSPLERIAKGNQEFINKMMKLFIDQMPNSVSEIQTAYKVGDFEKVKKMAHKIKPTIDIMEIVTLKDDIRDIEKNAEIYQSSEKLENLISQLDEVIGEVVDSLQQLSK